VYSCRFVFDKHKAICYLLLHRETVGNTSIISEILGAFVWCRIYTNLLGNESTINTMEQKRNAKSNAWLLAGVTAWGFITFLPTAKSFFVLDDFFWINFYKAFDLSELLKHYRFFFRIQCDGFYRPMIAYLYGLDFLVWKLNPLGYHLTNIIFHLANVLLVEALVYVLHKNKKLSISTALLFALHPLHVGAVAYVSGRTELVYVFFMLLSLILFAKFVRKEAKNTAYLFSVFFFACAIFSKETTVAFLVILAGTQYLLKKKINFLQILPYLLVTGAYFYIRQYAIRVPLNKYGFELGVENFTRLIYNYILVMVPVNVKSLYSREIVEFFVQNLWAFALLFTAFMLLCWKVFSGLIRRNRLDVSLVVYWLVWLVVSFFPIFFMSGDRLSYSPSIASSCITSAFFLALFKNKRRFGTLVYLPVVLTGVFFFTLTLDRTVIYNHAGTHAKNLLQNIQKVTPVIPDNSLVFIFNYRNDWIRDDTNWLKQYYGCLNRALQVAYRRNEIKINWAPEIYDDADMLEHLTNFSYKKKYLWGKNIIVLKNERFKIVNKTKMFEKIFTQANVPSL